jgi:hypothetical protein
MLQQKGMWVRDLGWECRNSYKKGGTVLASKTIIPKDATVM